MQIIYFSDNSILCQLSVHVIQLKLIQLSFVVQPLDISLANETDRAIKIYWMILAKHQLG